MARVWQGRVAGALGRGRIREGPDRRMRRGGLALEVALLRGAHGREDGVGLEHLERARRRALRGGGAKVQARVRVVGVTRARARPRRRRGRPATRNGLLRRGGVVQEERTGDDGQLRVLEALGQREVVPVVARGAPGQVQLVGPALEGPVEEPVHPSERV